MVRSINEAPKGFKGPSYEKVCTTLLDREVIHVEASMQPIKDSWIKTGVTIVSDGWKDVRNGPLVNVITASTRAAMFLKVVDSEGEVKDGPSIANILIQAIGQVGPQNVVQVASSSSSERNWSTYSFIHSIKRNRLNSKKADNLVVVHSNLRLTTQKKCYKKGEAKNWDVEPGHVEWEDSIADLDALVLDDDDHKLPSDVEADHEAEPDIASTDASGTFCAYKLQQQNDDDLFDGY